MKTGVFWFLLSALVFISPAPGGFADAAGPEPIRITAEELKQLMDEKGEHVLIDSRNAANHNEAHIEGAINIHYDPSGDPMTLKMTLMVLPMDKLIIVYCASEGDKTSTGLALELYGMGYDMDRIRILSGGMPRWKEAGYPVVSAGK